MGKCLKFTAANDFDAGKEHWHDKKLKIVKHQNMSYVNVDMSSPEGIAHAKDLKAIESGLIDAVTSEQLYHAASVFNKNNRGRMFTMFRDPMDRAISQFYYLGVAKWEPDYDPDLAHMSIQMYSRLPSNRHHNWMVRFLSNEFEEDLTINHLQLAKEVLRKKCLVGILSEKGESFVRYEKYFGWIFPSQLTRECQEKLLHWNWSNKNVHPHVEEGGPAWSLLAKKNELDIELYHYAKLLFKDQSKLFNYVNGQIVSRAY